MIEPGDIINNRYHVLQQLGKGNFGKTFEVKDEWLGDYDNKVIKIWISNNPNLERYYEQEYNVLKNLDHPGIPKVKAGGYLVFRCPHTDEILHGLVMEKIAGEDLGKWLEKNGKITNTKQAIEWLKQLSYILAHVHTQNYLHRDIKPNNIMLKPDGCLVLIDFGIVKEFIQKTQKETIKNTIIGTIGYCSPEQESGKNLNNTSDIFSLGRTFVHLLTGISLGYENLPTDSRTAKLLWRDKAPEISEAFKDLIDYLIEYEPRNRPKNTQEILQEIKELEIKSEKTKRPEFPAIIVFLSFALNLVFLTLLAMENILTPGWKVFFVVVIFVIGNFLVVPLIKYLF